MDLLIADSARKHRLMTGLILSIKLTMINAATLDMPNQFLYEQTNNNFSNEIWIDYVSE